MIPWTDIKRAAIRMNLDRKANGRTVDEMLEEVRDIDCWERLSIYRPDRSKVWRV